jgi:lysophospholipase L1-like esterase
MKKILCFGDSNTWGYISGTTFVRYEKEKRWTGILSNLLGADYEIIEEGLNSRTLNSEDLRPNKEGKRGDTYLLPCLDSHDPIDLVVIMLGTNELKLEFNKTALEISQIFEESFVKKILTRKSQFLDKYPKLLIIAPPVVNEFCPWYAESKRWEGAFQKSKDLNSLYEEISQKYNCGFISNEGLEVGKDGIHLTEESHAELASRVCKVILTFEEAVDNINCKVGL